MNKYLIPICDIQAGSIWIHTIAAKSTLDCQEKLMKYLIDTYDMEDCDSYRTFIETADSKYDILIGSIEDIEEL
jgi:hypothetical protein